ncbi:protein arginine kinase [Akkermansiaceae bacterium]|nr:protein arginine kinase [Akkermansiaceae bacterium]MDA7618856.1 protein arginine kinase [bacterium]MDA7629460.1 protein arginine kinase [Akkermansiaceae bacterium]MDA7683953.1 protein arginine kinase [Akkermansiaceae bacterium]MDA7863707.1 protein arginine kinase [Akkermansiaceae bacterium]
MMRFSTLLKHPADWMTGHDAETSVVVTSRVRLARNIRQVPFPGWARKGQRRKVFEDLKGFLNTLPAMREGFAHELSELDSLQKQVLVERHLISREQAARNEGSGSIVNRKQTLSLMINEEDHLRIQAIRPSLQLHEAYQLALSVDEFLEDQIDYAFHPEWGFLTACPTNLGTGMRASSMLHLPGLVLSDQIGQVLKGIGKLGLAVRGLYGEGTESLGNLYQISNQSTLGESEDQILSRLTKVIGDVARYETQARAKLLEDDPVMVQDRIGRATGILTFAHIIDSKEALTHLSMLRLGADIGVLPEELIEICDRLFMETQPAHLQWRAGHKLPPDTRDAMRAQMIREQLQPALPAAINIPDLEK